MLIIGSILCLNFFGLLLLGKLLLLGLATKDRCVGIILLPVLENGGTYTYLNGRKYQISTTDCARRGIVKYRKPCCAAPNCLSSLNGLYASGPPRYCESHSSNVNALNETEELFLRLLYHQQYQNLVATIAENAGNDEPTGNEAAIVGNASNITGPLPKVPKQSIRVNPIQYFSHYQNAWANEANCTFAYFLLFAVASTIDISISWAHFVLITAPVVMFLLHIYLRLALYREDGWRQSESWHRVCSFGIGDLVEEIVPATLIAFLIVAL